MQKMLNRLLCLALSAVLLLTLLPAARAAETAAQKCTEAVEEPTEAVEEPTEAVPTETAEAVLTEPEALAGAIAVDAVNFPDENFRSYILSQSYGADGWLTGEELGSVTILNTSRKNIGSLKGIEYFTALEYLFCSDNQLTSLDVSHNAALANLRCESNQLTNLDVRNCLELTCAFSIWVNGIVPRPAKVVGDNVYPCQFFIRNLNSCFIFVRVKTAFYMQPFPGRGGCY